MVNSEFVGLKLNQKLGGQLVYPENLSLISIIVLEKSNFEKD